MGLGDRRLAAAVCASVLVAACGDAGSMEPDDAAADRRADVGAMDAATDAGNVDAGSRDASTGADGGTDASEVSDAGADASDAGVAPTDAGPDASDAGAPPCDPPCEAAGEHSTASCVAGTCSYSCEEGWVDANEDFDAEGGPDPDSDGCELECTETNGGVEACDGLDNDCNGVVDDGFATGACTAGEGACEVSGSYVCVDSSTAECDAVPADPTDEVCGDGLDNDCDGSTDEDGAIDASTWYADGDGDGYGVASETQTACERPTGHAAEPGDCEPANSSVHPGAMERLGDAVDQDCDGVNDGAALRYAAMEWDGPSVPRVTATDHHYLLGAVASGLDDGTSYSNVGAVLTFDSAAADAGGPPTATLSFAEAATGTTVQGGGLDLVGRADDFYVTHAHATTTSRMRHLRYDHAAGLAGDYERRSGAEVTHAATTTEYGDFDSQVDASGRQWAVACGAGTIHVLAVDDDGDSLVAVEAIEDSSVTGGSSCYIDPATADTAHVHVFDGSSVGRHSAYQFDIGTTGAPDDGSLTSCSSACGDWSTLAVADVSHSGDVVAFAGSDTGTSPRGITLVDDGLVVATLAMTHETITADAWKVDATHWYVAAVVEDLDFDGLRDVLLFYGGPGAFDMTTLSITHPDSSVAPDPMGVSVYADTERLFLAVSADGGAGGDAIGWSFLGLP